MKIAEFHRLYKLVCDKSGSDFTSHEEVDDMANIAQKEYFAQLIGNLKQHQPGRAIPLVAIGQNSRLSEELNPFKERVSFHADTYDPATMPYGVENGVLVMPADYEHMSAVFSVVNHPTAGVLEMPVDDLDDEEWPRRASSSLIPPAQDKAIYRWHGTAANNNLQLEFRPKDISGYLVYYRTPAKPNYVYTLNPTTRVETHDAAASTDLEWNETACINILIRTLQLGGIKQADQMLYQAMGLNKNQDE